MNQYFLNLLISLDRFFNCLCAGSVDERLSERWSKKPPTDQDEHGKV